MAAEDYMEAEKRGQSAYRASGHKYLPALDEICDRSMIEKEESIGVTDIPLYLIVGTAHRGRTEAFADNFMPLLPMDTEFGAKWVTLSISHEEEGIHDPIKVIEYLHQYYVIEGNKRVSVMKYFGAYSIRADVTLYVPKMSDDPQVKIDLAYIPFYRATHVAEIWFSHPESFEVLMKLVGVTPGEEYPMEKRTDLVSSFMRFRDAFLAHGGAKFGYPVGDAYLRFIHIQNYNEVIHYSPSDMDKYVVRYWGEFELLGQSDEKSADVKLSPDASKPRSLLSFLIPGGTSVKALKVGFVYERNPEVSQWAYAHELGRKYLEEVFGEDLVTMVKCDVKAGETDESAIDELISSGCNLIFVTNAAMILACVKEAVLHPDVKILCNSLDISYNNVRTYSARLYEGKFLSGIIAGALTQTGKIGYVANTPIAGTFADINAFAMGTAAVNPAAKIYLSWSGLKEDDYYEDLYNEGCDLISTHEMVIPNSTKRRFGLFKRGHNDEPVYLAMTLFHWGIFYEKMIESIVSGSWKKDDDVKALNYWWGMSAGVVEFFMSNQIPEPTRRIVNYFESGIKTKEFQPFTGHLIRQDGTDANPETKELSYEQIVGMDYLLQNVIGDIPGVKQLDDDARQLVAAQGVIDKEGILLKSE
ncbi:MAG: BMP family ABC transporter substrate-binding protein [Lachnospiraceae bacterium]|jgi:basic membrane lipoprotein Med (substrate-binding protein (PBP1-ABC) superfamily)|nr:BMP family ABC transporter substrate-binding protein [Lachnospiraceae bacterium]MCH4030379.1 BMP family ABC transporter substrate-binding protein [Lachnospiraceae bacterium]MCH4069591.1 BMP family ABC transporter substrate-binding protein [Lachnospiraceae bacterium]MCH4107473.1 BMP family ABC transporter substrate-binding protein [Lachnospiraceae bacterium]MCI1301676.1 BMP family ABC transporter substrate-binding protein [Lachnospiraceae bacterium]